MRESGRVRVAQIRRSLFIYGFKVAPLRVRATQKFAHVWSIFEL